MSLQSLGTSEKISKVSPAVVGIVGLLVGVLYAVRLLIPAGGDPTILLAFGEESPIQTTYAERELGTDVILRPHLGHDGKFYFIQANDPLYLSPEVHAAAIDRPVYRAQRMLYPLLAGGLGLLPPAGVAWGMVAVNVLGLGIGSALTAQYAKSKGLTPWVGLAFALNLGLLAELDISGSGIVAFSAGVAGALAAERRRWGLCTVLLTGAVLTREVMVLFAVGVVFVEWLRSRRFVWPVVAVPLLAGLAWRAYLVIRIGHLPKSENQEVILAPFSGFVAGFVRWLHEPIDLVFGTVIVLLMIAFVLRAVSSRDLLAWGALGFVALTPFLSINVWAEWYDISRAVAPAFTAYVVLLVRSFGRTSANLEARE